MTGRASPASLLALAVDGLRRKIGRNLLTIGGVFIGVFALTLIVSLGEGMTRLVETAVSGEDNLRQIGLSGGLGRPLGDESEIEIFGEMSDARRKRLRRAALARTRHGTFIGRRVRALDAASLAELEEIEHVEVARPIVLERYEMTAGERETEATATLGVDVRRERYADRVIEGHYFTTPGADEALIHEYLAYQWGCVSDEELRSLLGIELVLEPIRNPSGGGFASSGFLAEMLGRLDLSALSEEERQAFPKIVEKLGRGLFGGGGAATVPKRHVVTVVGIVRELEAGDAIRVIEDGNASRVDVFLPLDTATRYFFEQPVNREIGFGRSYVVVDDAANVGEVEAELRKRGFTAFSVASVISRIGGFLGALTIVVSLLTGVALLVAALGIVNTMVTSVLERTHEIGLWKAVGATSGQVRTVFLLEAAMIGLLGGLLGLGVALLVQIPADALALRMISERAAFPLQGSVFHVPAWLPVAGPLLAAGIAMLAALYPAHRAARVDPVRALRHE